MDLKLKVGPKNLTKVAGRVKFSNLLDLEENEFKNLIQSIEDNELFKKLTFPVESTFKIISYRRYPNTGLNGNFKSLNEAIAASPQINSDVEPLIEKNKWIVEKIKRIGREKFEKYFLYCEGEQSISEIAQVCNITIDDVKKIIELVNSVSILNEFSAFQSLRDNSLTLTGLSADKSSLPLRDRIGKIVIKDNQCYVEFFSRYYGQGKYIINYQRLHKANEEGKFTENELKEIDKLIKNLEWLNSRKNITYQVIKNILEIQHEYFISDNDENKLKQFSQISLAKKLGIHRGSISRVCSDKCLEMPWGEERVLKSFFVSAKQSRKEFFLKIFHKYKNLTDKEIKKVLKEKHNIVLSRRTVCSYRNTLNFSKIKNTF